MALRVTRLSHAHFMHAPAGATAHMPSPAPLHLHAPMRMHKGTVKKTVRKCMRHGGVPKCTLHSCTHATVHHHHGALQMTHPTGTNLAQMTTKLGIHTNYCLLSSIMALEYHCGLGLGREIGPAKCPFKKYHGKTKNGSFSTVFRQIKVPL